MAALEEVAGHTGAGGPGEPTRARQPLSTHFFTFVTTITSRSLFTCRSLEVKKMLR